MHDTQSDRHLAEDPAQPLRVLTINSHQPYLHLLRELPYRFTVVDSGLNGRPCRWDQRIRPLPANFRLATLREATRQAEVAPFQVAIAHNLTDLMCLRKLATKTILVIHGTLDGRIEYEKSRTSQPDFLRLVSEFTAEIGTEVVFVSWLKRQSWPSLPGRIVPFAISEHEYGGYQGDRVAVLRVSHLQRQRNVLLNFSLQEEVLQGLPYTLLGENPDLPDVDLAPSWNDLKAAYQTHRCYLVTNHPRYEDGYNMAVQEAMMTGMPLVTTPHPTSPIRHEIEGLVGRNKTELRAHVERLLDDHELARALGEAARQRVQRLFPQAEFLAAWRSLLVGEPDADEIKPRQPRLQKRLALQAGGETRQLLKRRRTG